MVFRMSWYELSWPAQAMRAVLVYGWFLNRQLGLSASGALEGEAGLVLLGWEILLLIMVTVAAGMLVQMGFAIAAVASGQETTELLGEDERDKRIEARATVHGFTLTGLGFLASVLALWQGWGAAWAFNLMVGFLVAADVAVNLHKAFAYWRGE
jgi:hypothetical protein